MKILIRVVIMGIGLLWGLVAAVNIWLPVHLFSDLMREGANVVSVVFLAFLALIVFVLLHCFFVTWFRYSPRAIKEALAVTAAGPFMSFYGNVERDLGWHRGWKLTAFCAALLVVYWGYVKISQKVVGVAFPERRLPDAGKPLAEDGRSV